MPRRRRIVIVDDHPILRKGLAMVIDQEQDLLVAGEAEDAAAGLRMVEALIPDVVIVDLSLPGVDGIELIKTLKARHREVPALVVSMHDENLYAERALRAGARGYIVKQEAVDNVLVAIRKVLRGEIFVSDRIATRMVESLIGGDRKGANSPLDLLSDRELTVFRMIGQGLGTRGIAESLHLSVKTVESHRSHIKVKLQLASGVELVKHAVGWVNSNG